MILKRLIPILLAVPLLVYPTLFAENGLAEIVPGDGMAVYEFTDSSRIQNWAISSVSFCIKNHLMQGDNRNAFNPLGNVNRAQVAKALSNIAAAAKK